MLRGARSTLILAALELFSTGSGKGFERLAKPHAAQLLGMLQDADAGVRSSAAYMVDGTLLCAYDPVLVDASERAEAIRMLSVLLHDADKWVRSAAKHGLQSIANGSAVPDTDSEEDSGGAGMLPSAARAAERQAAAEALRRAGGAADEAASGAASGEVVGGSAVKTEGKRKERFAAPKEAMDAAARKMARRASTPQTPQAHAASSSRVDGGDGDESDEDGGDSDEMGIVGERSWEERQAMLKAGAVNVDSDSD